MNKTEELVINEETAKAIEEAREGDLESAVTIEEFIEKMKELVSICYYRTY